MLPDAKYTFVMHVTIGFKQMGPLVHQNTYIFVVHFTLNYTSHVKKCGSHAFLKPNDVHGIFNNHIEL